MTARNLILGDPALLANSGLSAIPDPPVLPVWDLNPNNQTTGSISSWPNEGSEGPASLVINPPRDPATIIEGGPGGYKYSRGLNDYAGIDTTLQFQNGRQIATDSVFSCVVRRLASTPPLGNEVVVDGFGVSTRRHALFVYPPTNQWGIYAGVSVFFASAADTNWHRITIFVSGTNCTVLFDGVQVVTGANCGTAPMQNIGYNSGAQDSEKGNFDLLRYCHWDPGQITIGDADAWMANYPLA